MKTTICLMLVSSVALAQNAITLEYRCDEECFKEIVRNAKPEKVIQSGECVQEGDQIVCGPVTRLDPQQHHIVAVPAIYLPKAPIETLMGPSGCGWEGGTPCPAPLDTDSPVLAPDVPEISVRLKPGETAPFDGRLISLHENLRRGKVTAECKAELASAKENEWVSKPVLIGLIVGAFVVGAGAAAGVTAWAMKK